jgi:hypothetical protein|tara:strand:+ start:19273 stop:19575 length:303 start_codon:yes stop_codon:yes gene_type:complete
VLSDDQATHILQALDALDELEAAALKLLRAELQSGQTIDGLIVDPLTEGSRLDLLCLTDTLAVDLLSVLGRRESIARLIETAPNSSARDAIAHHFARGTV